MIGRRIALRLMLAGYRVRILSRRTYQGPDGVEIVAGSLSDRAAVNRLTAGAHAVFHCAAELRDESIMDEVNIRGTENVLAAAAEAGAKYFCHLSSVGVIGLVTAPEATEATDCRPQNQYERSKLLAEQQVGQGIRGARVTILRPTNVVAEENFGAVRFLFDNTVSTRRRLFLIAGESAHIVHADDVADAAVYRMSAGGEGVERLIVSTDHEPGGSYGDLWSLIWGSRRKPLHVPPAVPWLIRRALRRPRSRGDLRYSSNALLATGFRYQLDPRGAVSQLLTAGEG